MGAAGKEHDDCGRPREHLKTMLHEDWRQRSEPPNGAMKVTKVGYGSGE
jgi:hypothetical protein